MTWLRQRAEVSPQATAIRCGEEELTFAQLDRRVRAVAGVLNSREVRRGDRVALSAPASLDWVITFYSLLDIGAIPVLLNMRLTPSDRARQMQLVGTSYTVHEAPSYVSAPAESTEKAVTPKLCLHRLRQHDGTPGPAQPNAPHIPCCVLFTSGTTGEGKPVLLSRENMWWSALGSVLTLGSSGDDLWLDCLPLYHVGGLSILIRGLLCGVPVWLLPGFDELAVNAAVDSGGVTMISLVSTMLSRLLDTRNGRTFPGSLRCILLGGGPVPNSLLLRCSATETPIAVTYGMTETSSQAATLPPTERSTHPQSAGRSLIGVDISVEQTDGYWGNIRVAGPAVSLSARVGSKSHIPWVVTGDIGRLDSDGYLMVSDRREDLIVTGGENVHPSEVEAVLLTHEGVADAAVLGVPEAVWGQVVTGVLVAKADDLDLDDVDQYCRARLPGFKCPRYYRILSELPRTMSGKLLRRELRRLTSESWAPPKHG